MNKAIDEFFAHAATDPALDARLQAAPDADSIVTLAAEAGHTFTAAELLAAAAAQPNPDTALSDDALDAVVGGATVKELQSQFEEQANRSASTMARLKAQYGR